MSEKQYMLSDFDSGVEMLEKINEQQSTIQEQDRRIKELERMLKKCDAERIRLQNERGTIIKFGVRGGSNCGHDRCYVTSMQKKGD